MTLGSSQPLRDVSTRNIPWDKGGRCIGLTNLPLSYAFCHEIWEPSGPVQACIGVALPLPYPIDTK